jgi:electron transfer flavoprotein alpha subunit
MWVLIEHRDGEIEEASLEVLSEARRLANKAKLKVSALVLGHSGTCFADALSQYGADQVYGVEHALLAAYTTDGYTAALTALLQEHQPRVLLLAATALGRDLAPRLAVRLGAGLVSDCTVLDINAEGALEMTRPSCGGRVYSTLVTSGQGPQLATVRPGVLGLGKPLRGRQAAVAALPVELRPEQIRTRVLGCSKVEREKLDIAEAEVVLAFGRGLRESALLPQMQELARLLDASLGGSRAAVDERWLPFGRQIGQTGKTIAPKVIVCCGISGAQQFVMGMRESRFIVAINTDRNAPIFKAADVSVLGNLHEVMPALIERLQGLAAPKS